MNDNDRSRRSDLISNFLITLTGFGCYFFLDRMFFGRLMLAFNGIIHEMTLSYLLAYLVVIIPLLPAAWFVSQRQVFSGLGLRQSILRPLLISFVCTLPMLAGYALVFTFNRDVTAKDIIKGAVAAAFFEELIFRGYFFGMIYRYTRTGFIPSVLIPSVVFASLHLYQSDDPGILSGIFITTLMGSALFAWVYTEWGYNLWIPVFLHFFMNLFWMMFSAGETAFGGVWSNVFRVLTIAMVIAGTVIYKRKKGKPLLIRKRTLWLKPLSPVPVSQ